MSQLMEHRRLIRQPAHLWRSTTNFTASTKMTISRAWCTLDESKKDNSILFNVSSPYMTLYLRVTIQHFDKKGNMTIGVKHNYQYYTNR